MVLRSPMASEAPLHLQRLRLVHQWHLVDRSMTGIASHSLSYVDAVIEKNKVRKLVDARPLQRLTGPIARPHRLEQAGVGPDLRMAIHTGLRRRNSREARGLNRGVAVAAIDAQSRYMVLMAEGNWLRLANPRIRHVGRTLDGINHPSQCCHDKYGAKNSGPRQTIRTAIEDLRHSLMRSGEQTRRIARC
jgi:hypothetical protein